MRRFWAAGALVVGISVAAPAWAQAPAPDSGGGCPGDCPMHAEGKTCNCPGHAEGKRHMHGCPMMAAKQAGVQAKVEDTDRGAVIRLEGPKGNTQARDEARKVARHVAKMTEEGCPHAGHGAPPAGTEATPGKQTSKGG